MIVEFLKDNAFRLAFAKPTDDPGGRLELDCDGRPMRLHPSRALVVSQEGEPGDPAAREGLLKEVGRRREALASKVDLATLWELLEDDGQGPDSQNGSPIYSPMDSPNASQKASPNNAPPIAPKDPADAPEDTIFNAPADGRPDKDASPGPKGREYPYPYLAQLALGADLGPDGVSAVMRAVHRDGTRFKFKPAAAIRNPKELLLKAEAEREEARARERALVEGGEWLALRIGGKSPKGEPFRKKEFLGHLTDLAISEDGKGAPPEYPRLLGALGFTPDPAGAFQALVSIGEFSPHENLELRRLGLPLGFSADAMGEAERLSGLASNPSGKEFQGRLDLSGSYAITVDSEGAMEYDDALSLEPRAHGGIRLGIHIADPTAFIRHNSALDKAARLQAASIYLPDGCHPMLPQGLTDSLLSLRKCDRPRPALSLLIDLTEDHRPLRHSFKRSLVSVDRHLTFREADREMEGQGRLGETLRGLHAISKAFLKKRLGQGGFLFNLPQRQLRVGSDGTINFSLLTFDTLSYVMLGELMIVANNLAAMSLRDQNFPCPYRYQLLFRQGGGNAPKDPPPPEDPRELFAHNLALRRRLGRSGISLSPSRHRGLGLQAYTFFTSPMRRYFDMLVHRQIGSLAARVPAFLDRASMEREALAQERLLKAVHRAQQARERYFLLCLLSKKVGDTFEALAYERKGDRTWLCVTDYMLDVELHGLPESVRPGTLFGLRLMAADPRGGQPLFAPA
ncbi:MAG: RNB domain-containing ribonuclease [Deltaproteobacteria bacterium]|jgi:exoribonuclease-2|nr:RNB domain-containing ribonuclease [Deltaproteobacteria bacterium]